MNWLREMGEDFGTDHRGQPDASGRIQGFVVAVAKVGPIAVFVVLAIVGLVLAIVGLVTYLGWGRSIAVLALSAFGLRWLWRTMYPNDEGRAL